VLDNGGKPSADCIVPDLQTLSVGEIILSVMALAHEVMERRQLHNLRRRAEALAAA
jgi:hypothetical protein